MRREPLPASRPHAQSAGAAAWITALAAVWIAIVLTIFGATLALRAPALIWEVRAQTNGLKAVFEAVRPHVQQHMERFAAPDTALQFAAAAERAVMWERRLDALFTDKRIAALGAAAFKMGAFVETRGAEIGRDVEAALNATHALAARMRLLGALA